VSAPRSPIAALLRVAPDRTARSSSTLLHAAVTSYYDVTDQTVMCGAVLQWYGRSPKTWRAAVVRPGAACSRSADRGKSLLSDTVGEQVAIKDPVPNLSGRTHALA